MRRTRTLATLLLLAVISTACASLTPDVAMKSWMGKPVQGAVLAWGPPARTITDGGDGQVFEWRFWQPPMYLGRLGTVAGYWRSRSLYARADGTVYAYRWQGL